MVDDTLLHTEINLLGGLEKYINNHLQGAKVNVHQARKGEGVSAALEELGRLLGQRCAIKRIVPFMTSGGAATHELRVGGLFFYARLEVNFSRGAGAHIRLWKSLYDVDRGLQ